MAAFVDNNANLWESRLIDDVKCISPLDLKEIAFDFIIISCNAREEIIRQIVDNLNIEKSKILDPTFMVLNCGETFHLGNMKINRNLPFGFIDVNDLKSCLDQSSLLTGMNMVADTKITVHLMNLQKG